MQDFHQRFQALPIVGILRGIRMEELPAILEASVAARLSTLEITMNTPGVSEMIQLASETYGHRLNIGVGTVRNEAELDLALEAGAQFVVMPILDQTVIQRCKEAEIPVFPGAYTPTEVYRAWEWGATAVKVFPAGLGGVRLIKAIQGPLDHIPLIPTGGVTKENLGEFFDLGVRGVGMGGKLFPKALIQQQDWDGLTNHLAQVVGAYQDWKAAQS